jgi:hypothetical protein
MVSKAVTQVEYEPARLRMLCERLALGGVVSARGTRAGPVAYRAPAPSARAGHEADAARPFDAHGPTAKCAERGEF